MIKPWTAPDDTDVRGPAQQQTESIHRHGYSDPVKVRPQIADSRHFQQTAGLEIDRGFAGGQLRRKGHAIVFQQQFPVRRPPLHRPEQTLNLHQPQIDVRRVLLRQKLPRSEFVRNDRRTTTKRTQDDDILGIDEGNDGSINQYASIYAKPITGTQFTVRSFGEGRNMYGVAFAGVPEPSSSLLLGAVAAAALHRRRRTS